MKAIQENMLYILIEKGGHFACPPNNFNNLPSSSTGGRRIGDAVGLRAPLPELLLQPAPQGRHALLRPVKGLRLNMFRQLKAGVFIDPRLNPAAPGPALPLEAVAEGPEAPGIYLRLGEKSNVQKRETALHAHPPQ